MAKSTRIPGINSRTATQHCERRRCLSASPKGCDGARTTEHLAGRSQSCDHNRVLPHRKIAQLSTCLALDPKICAANDPLDHKTAAATQSRALAFRSRVPPLVRVAKLFFTLTKPFGLPVTAGQHDHLNRPQPDHPGGETLRMKRFSPSEAPLVSSEIADDSHHLSSALSTSNKA